MIRRLTFLVYSLDYNTLSLARYVGTLLIALAGALGTPHADAEKVVVYREGQRVEPRDVADVLGRTRGIRLLPDEPTAATKAVSDASALALPVRFAFASAEIVPAARVQLDALAQGIKLLAPGRTVTIEGHTDAAGGDEYNRELSRARARAVRDYLVQHHNLAPARLATVGYGKDRPIAGTDPHDGLNRRVQFRGS